MDLISQIAIATGGIAVLLLGWRLVIPRRPTSHFRAGSFSDPVSLSKSKKATVEIPSRFPRKDDPPWKILDIEPGEIRRDVIKTAVRKKLQEFHPDRFAQESAEVQNLARVTTELILRARDIFLKSK